MQYGSFSKFWQLFNDNLFDTQFFFLNLSEKITIGLRNHVWITSVYCCSIILMFDSYMWCNNSSASYLENTKFLSGKLYIAFVTKCILRVSLPFREPSLRDVAECNWPRRLSGIGCRGRVCFSRGRSSYAWRRGNACDTGIDKCHTRTASGSQRERSDCEPWDADH